MAKKKADAPAQNEPEDQTLDDLAGMDSVSPEGGYAGPDSETEAAKAALNQDLPEPDLGSAE